ANVNWRDDNKRGCGPVGVAIRTGQAHIIHDMKTENRFEPWRQAALESGYASSVAIPLAVEGMVLGIMVVYSSETNDFDKEKLELLGSLANNLAYGIHVLRSEHERKKADWLLGLEKKALEQISASQQPDIILQEMIASIEEKYTDIYCSVSLLVDEGQYLIPYAASRLPEEYEKELGKIKIGPSVGSCGTAAYRNENVFVSNIAKDPLWKDYKNLASKFGLRACWSMPIASALGEVYGTIAIYYKEPKEADNEHVELMGHIRNIAEISFKQYKSKNELIRSENRYRALYDGTPAMFFTINQDYSVASVNKFGAEKLGYHIDDLIGQSTLNIVFSDDREDYRNNMEACFLDSKNTHNWEIRKVKNNGSIIWSRESARVIEDIDGTQKLLVVSEDITEAHKLSQQLSYQASHDALTGLVNRREFEIRLERLINESEGSGEEHALCYLDLDQFKVINDTCGHLAGDELLRQLGELFKSKVRKKDTLARLGGDEFGVLMENCSLDQAQRVAHDLRELVEEFHFVWTDKRFSIGVSIGLVLIDDSGGNTVTEILSAADASCYAAKDAGRNRVHVYHPEDIDLAVHRGQMQWVSRINHALEEDRFRLYLQPIISLSEEDEDKKHYECLIRMIDEDGKIILPGAFLPAAERYDLSIKIDRWVFDSVYAWMAKRPGKLKGLTHCSVNLSGHSLSNEAFLNDIVNKLDDGKVPPSNICFEITETVAISRLSNAIRFMEVLKDKGCFFALDDFGSGVSSFGYLKNLPVDFLKIDGMFVRDMVNDPIDLEMVRSINEIGHVMGKKTIAEFVENEEILECLKELGVDYAQGYYMGKPRAIRIPGSKVSHRKRSKKKVNKKKRFARTRKTD
ncbi:MAG: EAL domain-containing protein, partial [Proteobacteria bacterium]|nr:EAL domain-containing protein [Pseudomonadota bacterium]